MAAITVWGVPGVLIIWIRDITEELNKIKVLWYTSNIFIKKKNNWAKIWEEYFTSTCMCLGQVFHIMINCFLNINIRMCNSMFCLKYEIRKPYKMHKLHNCRWLVFWYRTSWVILNSYYNYNLTVNCSSSYIPKKF